MKAFWPLDWRPPNVQHLRRDAIVSDRAIVLGTALECACFKFEAFVGAFQEHKRS